MSFWDIPLFLCAFFDHYSKGGGGQTLTISLTSLTLHHYHLTHEAVLPLVSHPWKDIVSHKVEKVEPHLFWAFDLN